jgi:hypothetical protein
MSFIDYDKVSRLSWDKLCSIMEEKGYPVRLIKEEEASSIIQNSVPTVGENAVRWQALTKGLNTVAGYVCLI